MKRPVTYVRPMRHWWLKLPIYRWYLLREATCVCVIAYALVLLIGLACLAKGRAEYDAFRAVLATPWSIAFHALVLLAVLYHAWTWFKVMPKTLPFVRIGARRMTDAEITLSGVSAAVLASAALAALAWWGLG